MLASVLDAWVTRLECPKGAKDKSRGPTRSRGPEGLYTSRNNDDYKKIPCSSLEWREGTFATVARTRGVGCLWAEIHLVQVCNFRSNLLLGFFLQISGTIWTDIRKKMIAKHLSGCRRKKQSTSSSSPRQNAARSAASAAFA